MIRTWFVLPILLWPLSAAARDLTPDQRGDVRCVAALAIVANDQQRGAPGWETFPDVTQSGAHFADLVRQRISDATGMPDDRIESEIRASIRQLQKDAIKSDDPQDLAQSIVKPCLAKMAEIDPPVPAPGDLRCAALAAIAHQDMRARDGVTNPVTAMMVLASVFESEARKALFAQGKTQVESDAILGLERERVAQTPAEDAQAVYRNGAELRQCMASVRPQLQKKPH